MSHIARFISVLFATCGLAAFTPAHAAQSYDGCAGFIDSVPTTISTQGTWCLRRDLATAITSGNAITIATNNVTIDCNGFKLGGLAAGNGSNTIGIRAESRQNATVRNCNIRGFLYGIYLNGGAGHLVEDNRLDNNLYYGIHVSGDNGRVRRNAVYDTGGGTAYSSAFGIHASAYAVDNIVSGLFTHNAGGNMRGITATQAGAQVRDNMVSGFDATAVQGGTVYSIVGIYLADNWIRASGNQVAGVGSASISSYGIWATNSDYCLDNTVSGFSTNIGGACTNSGNLTSP